MQQNRVALLTQQGLAFHQQGRLTEAQAIYEEILAIQANHFDALQLLGAIFIQTQQFTKAVDYLTKALQINPAFAEAYYNRGIALKELKRYEEALESYDQAIHIKPDYAEAYFNRGNALQVLKRLEESLASYDQAIVIKPDYVNAFNNRGVALQDLKRLDEALLSCDQAIILKPDHAEAFYNRGNALKELKRLNEALASYDQAIRIKPNYAEAYFYRGNTLQDLKRLDEALLSYDRVIALKPDYDFLLGIQQHLKMHLCIWDNFDDHIKILLSKILQKKNVSLPFPLLALIDEPKIHQLASQVYIDQIFPTSKDVTPFLRSRIDSKIRIGYFSADFHDHATMHLMAELFEHHDKEQFEIIAFSFGPTTNDAWQLRAIKTFDQFIDCQTKTDGEIALLSRNLGIDIAVDLKGFTTDARTGIFAQRAAPIQVNFLGYPGTMGAEYIDYLIADAVLVPVESQSFYDEKIAYLPDCYQPNCHTRDIELT